MSATADLIATISGTFVVIVAVYGGVLTSRAWAASIVCTSVVIVAADGSVDATSIVIRHTLFGGTVSAVVADNGCEDASGFTIAGIGCADVVIVTDNRCFSATGGWTTSVKIAFVWFSTRDINMLTTQIVIAGVLSALVVVIAGNWSLSTTENVIASVSITLASFVTARRVIGIDASGGTVAGCILTSSVIIANDRCVYASIHRAAVIGSTFIVIIANNRDMRATCFRITRVGGTSIVIIAAYCGVRASNELNAFTSVTFIA